MKQTVKVNDPTPCAVGAAMSKTSGKVWAAVVARREDGPVQTHKAVFDLAAGLDGRLRQFLQQSGDGRTMLAAGLDASQIRFLQLTLPPAETVHLPRLIAAQTEAKLPLSGDQMRLAWRLSPTPHGYDCTVAAARREATAALGTLDGQVAAVMPDAAGLPPVVRAFFVGAPATFILLRRRVDGLLLARIDGDVMTACAMVPVESAAAAIGEVRMELEAMAPTRTTPVCLWPDESPLMRQAAEALTQAGRSVGTLSVNAAAVKRANLTAELASDELFIEAAGLAMLSLSHTAQGFDFLQSRRAAAPQEAALQRRKQWFRSLAITAGLLLLCLAAHYGGLKMRVAQLRRELAAETEQLSAKTILERQGFRESVARVRLDVLELLTAIQDSRDGLLLDAIEFEAGKPIRLTASAGGYDQVYGFQKRLAERPGVSQLKLIDPRLDDKSGQVRFTMQFHYKQYTK